MVDNHGGVLPPKLKRQCLTALLQNNESLVVCTAPRVDSRSEDNDLLRLETFGTLRDEHGEKVRYTMTVALKDVTFHGFTNQYDGDSDSEGSKK